MALTCGVGLSASSLMSAVTRLINDLDQTIVRDAPSRRETSLRRITDLFLRNADALTDEQLDLFDVVIARLAAAIETRARAELSERLAPVPNAPRGVIRSLAHDEILVARPVLARSERLSDDDLVAVALAKGREHMLAITEREALTEPVTDVLVSRGDRQVVHAVTANPGARFSEGSLARLVDRSRLDEPLLKLLEGRADLPEAHWHTLLTIARETARRRLAEGRAPRDGRALEAALERGTSAVAAEVSGGPDYRAALAEVDALAAERPLTEADLARAAGQGRVEVAVCLAARLAELSLAGAERLFRGGEQDLALVVAKALGWSWATLRQLLSLREPALAAHEMHRAQSTYERLAPATAERVLEFVRRREEASRQAASAAARQHDGRRRRP